MWTVNDEPVLTLLTLNGSYPATEPMTSYSP